MAGVLSTLYPPIVDTYQPSNVIDESMTVYFTMSEYNYDKVADIKYLHFSLINQSTNATALLNGAPIRVIDFKDVNCDSETGIYSFTISPSLVSSSKSFNNTVHKIQIRFDINTATLVLDDDENNNINKSITTIQTYINNYSDNFSEWSQATLIKPIDSPIITFSGFSDTKPTFDLPAMISTDISATLSFNDTTETDSLQQYRFILLTEPEEDTRQTTLLEREWINSNHGFSIKDSINLDNYQNQTLVLKLEYVTTNGYHGEEFITIIANNDGNDDGTDINVIFEEECGINTITLTNSNQNNLYLYRTSSLSNFTDYMLVSEKISLTDNDISRPKTKYVIKDITIESGIQYKYALQSKKLGKNSCYTAKKYGPVTNNFYDATLARDGQILHLSYNFVINQYSRKVGRALAETLGGKYPKFTKNGNLNYKQFTISGLIAIEDNISDYFVTLEDLFGSEGVDQFYDKHQDASGNIINPHTTISSKYDIVIQRKFREYVYDWLNDGKEKLFRSGPEGNLVIILDGISLTPNKTLSRAVYDFSATMYEVADAEDYETLVSLGVIE